MYKTNWWDLPGADNDPKKPGGALNQGAYDPFYPLNLAYIPDDLGLLVPDPFYLPELVAAQEAMPGIKNPYRKNDKQAFARFDTDLPFFVNFSGFGYEQTRLNLFSADGIPVTTFDDFGLVNPYPLMRLSAVDKKTKKVMATVDTVAPVSGEVQLQELPHQQRPLQRRRRRTHLSESKFKWRRATH